MEKILLLQGVTYRWNDTARQQMGLPGDPQIGLVAQDVAQVFPELVTKDSDGYLMIDYSRLVPVLIEAIKTQQAQIEALQQRLLLMQE